LYESPKAKIFSGQSFTVLAKVLFNRGLKLIHVESIYSQMVLINFSTNRNWLSNN